MTDFEKKENEVTEDELSAEEVNVFGNCGVPHGCMVDCPTISPLLTTEFWERMVVVWNRKC